MLKTQIRLAITFILLTSLNLTGCQTTSVQAEIASFWVNYPIDDKLKDACKSGGLKCPPTHGADNVYRFLLMERV